jgi:hypothetical protein
VQGKKSLYWQTRFGRIEVTEQTYRRGRTGPLVRPFASSAGVACRGTSLGLQRALVDFGAEESFAQAVERVREHYGIVVQQGALRHFSEWHGAALQAEQAAQTAALPATGHPQMIGELDGSLIPLVTTSAAPDRRKTRVLSWQEARLALAHAQGSVTPRFSATLGSVPQAGACLAVCVAQAGGGQASRVHCVSDGAPWIAEQVEARFPGQAEYLLDFYHVCEYLARAAPVVAGAKAAAWRLAQQAHLRGNRARWVLTALRPHLEADTVPESEAPVRACYRYLHNRLAQLNYKEALARDLPIGSGEIESAHRYVIQQRLKLAGAWWKKEHAASLLALRVCRANHDWEDYWQRLRQAAA